MVDNTFDRLTKRLHEKVIQKESGRNENGAQHQVPSANDFAKRLNNEKIPGTSKSIIRLPGGREISTYQTYIDTHKCKIWDGNNRLAETRNDHTLEELKNTIEAQGQLVPGFVRPINDGQYEFEVIYGSRRFSACDSLGCQFLAQIGEVSDKEALILMDAENTARKELSVYEKAISYQEWLEKKYFKDRADLAEHLGVTSGWISKIQSILKLPDEVLEAFNSKTEIKVWWAVDLLKIVKSSEEAKNKLIEVALKKSDKIKDPTAVYKYLFSPSVDKRNQRNMDKVKNNKIIKIKNKTGMAICEISQSSDGKVKAIFAQGMDIDEVKKALEKIYLDDKVWEF